MNLYYFKFRIRIQSLAGSEFRIKVFQIQVPSSGSSWFRARGPAGSEHRVQLVPSSESCYCTRRNGFDYTL
jgi:hypothetical protein